VSYSYVHQYAPSGLAELTLKKTSGLLTGPCPFGCSLVIAVTWQRDN